VIQEPRDTQEIKEPRDTQENRVPREQQEIQVWVLYLSQSQQH
jgi:hypothetical protein